MANVDAFIESTLRSAQEEIAAKEAVNRAEDDETSRRRNDGGVRAEQFHFPTADEFERQEEREARDLRIAELKAQVQLLAEIKGMMGEQHAETTAMLVQQQTENKADFTAIKQRDDQSTRFSVLLTAGSSAVSLVAGWLLSLATSPTSVLHAFGH